MQIVIDIPEEVYKSIQDNDYCGISNADMYNAVKNGIPIPKGHGRLIDVDDKENLTICFDDRGIIKKIEAPTIIEADKAESEEQA